jgi:hypothetical protein
MDAGREAEMRAAVYERQQGLTCDDADLLFIELDAARARAGKSVDLVTRATPIITKLHALLVGDCRGWEVTDQELDEMSAWLEAHHE